MTGCVLHLITTLDRGGAELALLELVQGQLEAGWRVEVAYLKGPGELTSPFEQAGAPVHALHGGGLGTIGAYGRARRAARVLAPDVVHTHLMKADTLGAALVGRGRERPALVCTKHNEDAYLSGTSGKARTFRAVARRVSERADARIAITDAVRRFFARELGADWEEAQVVPYGVPVPEEPEPRGALRRELGLASEEPVVVCAARFVPQKDHRTLLAAFRTVLESHPTARLVLLGRGPTEDDVRRMATACGDAVRFEGFVDDPQRWYRAADMLALASRHEGLGRVVLEAAAVGTPAVVTAVGGLPEVVEDGRTGLLTPLGDAAALAHALTSLLSDPNRRESMGRAALKRVQAEFSPTRCLERTLTAYDRARSKLR